MVSYNLAAMSGWRHRLEKAIANSGLTRAEVARAAGVNPTMLRDILDRGQTPSVDNLAKIARALNLKLGNLYDGELTSEITISVGGVLSGGEEVVAYIPDRGPTVSLNLFAEDIAFVQIASDEYAPTYRKGDTVGGVRTASRFAHNLIRRECIVETTAGKQYVGILMPGNKPNTFTIRSLIPGRDDVANVHLRWVAPISLIMR